MEKQEKQRRGRKEGHSTLSLFSVIRNVLGEAKRPLPMQTLRERVAESTGRIPTEGAVSVNIHRMRQEIHPEAVLLVATKKRRGFVDGLWWVGGKRSKKWRILNTR